MSSRVDMHKQLLELAIKLCDRDSKHPESITSTVAECLKIEYSISLHEFVTIMNLAKPTADDALLLQPVAQLSAVTFPHTPDLAPFGQFWLGVFLGFADDQDDPLRPSSVSVDAATMVAHSLAPDRFRERLMLGPTCVLIDAAEQICYYRDQSIFSIRADKPERHDFDCCESCNPTSTLENFMASLGLEYPRPSGDLGKDIEYSEDRWQIWQEIDPSEEADDPRFQDHFLLEYVQDDLLLAGERMHDVGGMLSVTFGLGRVLLEAHAETPNDLYFNESWIASWNERMAIFQEAVEFAEAEELRQPTETTADPRRLVRWSYVDVPSRGTDLTTREFLESFAYDIDDVEGLQPFVEQTWLELFLVLMRTTHNPQFAGERRIAAHKRATSGERNLSSTEEDDPKDPGTTVEGLSLEEKEKFLARYADQPKYQSWSDEEIYFGICMGM